VLASGRPPDPSAEEPTPGPSELWRCHACAKAPGKAWIPCRTVTGRGNEEGARDRVRERVCQEAGVSVEDCEVTTLDCRRLEEPAVGAEGQGARPPE
jgi:hypothetical protein